ncbi:MAG TPA: GNAT family N-acetyltransferase [Pseudonocardiaceae bacterium]|nr:GNAT family N-acetyltransferase [Pseudonocardiaceae bacterium]
MTRHATDLLTQRLRLHPITVEEGNRIADGTPGAGDRWADQFPMQDDRDGIAGYLTAAAAGSDPAPFCCYRIDLNETAIGTIGFFGPPDDHGEVTIGYGLVPGARGFGYATEAVGGLVEFCRSQDGVRVVLADTAKDNGQSQRVLEKSGFAFLRETDELRYYRLSL